MRTARSDAIDLFRSWLKDNCRIRVQGTFPLFAFASWGRVLSVDDRELRIMSDDAESELVVKFGEVVEFGYEDNRHAPGRERRFGEAISIFFGPVPEEGDVDFIILAAEKSV